MAFSRATSRDFITAKEEEYLDSFLIQPQPSQAFSRGVSLRKGDLTRHFVTPDLDELLFAQPDR